MNTKLAFETTALGVGRCLTRLQRLTPNAAVLLVLLLSVWSLPAQAIRIQYNVRPVPPTATASAVTQVRILVSELSGAKTVSFQMPVWSPGDYAVQNHGQYVRGARAQTPYDRGLPVTHPDASTWTVDTQGETAIEFSYTLPNTPPGNFSENVKVTDRYAFYDGPALYMYVVGQKGAPVRLAVSLPQGWRAITPLDPVTEGASREVAHFNSPDYDTLADSPLLAGQFETREFQHEGRPHVAAFFNRHAGANYDDTMKMLQKVVAEQNRLMGGPPYSRYIFFLDVGGRGGGLEHANSTRMGWFAGGPARFMAGFAVHEFFHLWNVKRIRPAVLGPFDYQRVPRTRNLWFAEGVTSYYGDLSVQRAGFTTPEEYMDGLGQTITALQNTPARLRITADESSLRVGETRGSQGFGGLSYYLKGELIGLCLDLKIRGLTQNQRSLDHVMRDLMAKHAPPKPGYPEDGIREAVIRAAGPDMGPFYDVLARSTEEMPFDACLRYAGLRLQRRGNGFAIAEDPSATSEQRALRASWLSGR